MVSKKTLSIVQGYHEKGICSVNFSSSGRYLVTVGLGSEHKVAVWKWSDGKVEFLLDKVSFMSLLRTSISRYFIIFQDGLRSISS